SAIKQVSKCFYHREQGGRHGGHREGQYGASRGDRSKTARSAKTLAPPWPLRLLPASSVFICRSIHFLPSRPLLRRPPRQCAPHAAAPHRAAEPAESSLARISTASFIDRHGAAGWAPGATYRRPRL